MQTRPANRHAHPGAVDLSSPIAAASDRAAKARQREEAAKAFRAQKAERDRAAAYLQELERQMAESQGLIEPAGPEEGGQETTGREPVSPTVVHLSELPLLPRKQLNTYMHLINQTRSVRGAQSQISCHSQLSASKPQVDMPDALQTLKIGEGLPRKAPGSVF